MGHIILVVGNKDVLTTGDLIIRGRLEGAGHTVTEASDEDAEFSGAYDGVFVSDSASGAIFNTGAKYRTVDKPGVTTENAAWLLGTYLGTGDPLSSWSVTSTPTLSAGLSGTVAVYDAATQAQQGIEVSTLPAGAQIVATALNDADKATYVFYESGATLVTGTAPARRVFFRVGDGAMDNLTADGLALLDGAIEWAFGSAGLSGALAASAPMPTADIDGTTDITGAVAGTLPMPTADIAGTASFRAPGSVFNLDNWKVTLPTDGGDGGTDADEVTQPALDTHADQYFHLNESDEMVMIAPVVGATTSGSDGTRYELREMEGGTEADWDIATSGLRQLTVTAAYDPTSITGGTGARQEMIVAQIHGATGTPPLYLAVEFTSGTPGTPLGSPRLRVYKDGPGVSNPLTGLTSSTLITHRIRIDSGRVEVSACLGDRTNLPAEPQHDWAAGEFADNTNCYLKTGPYNKTTVASGSSGEARATIQYLELLQPSDSLQGELTASIPMATADLGGVVTATGTAAGASPMPTADLDGSVTAAGDLAGDLPLVAASVTGSVTATGQAAGTVPLPAAGLTGSVTADGALVGGLPMPTAALGGGGGTDSGGLLASAPLPTAALTGDAYVLGALASSVPLVVGALAGDVDLSGAALTGTAPMPIAALVGSLGDSGALAGVLPLPVMAAASGGGEFAEVTLLQAGPPVRRVFLMADVPTR